ncbi:hypothetical protein Tco_1227761 [Tanacetum coccineum]
MVISSPCLIDNKELTSPEQTAPGKDFSNPLIVDSLLKTIWSSMHHVFTMKHWLVQSKRLLSFCYALTKKPEVVSPLSILFWWFLRLHNVENGEVKDKCTIDGHSLSITEGSLRFIQICLDMQKHHLQQHTRIYPVPTLSMKVFSNMKRSTKGFSGQEVALFLNMLTVTTPSTSPSRITSSPSPTPSPTQPSPTQPSPTQPSPTQPSPTQPATEHHLPTPHDSPLHVVHSHGSDEGSLKLQELMNLVTTLSDRIGVLEADLLKVAKKTYKF